MFWDTVITGGDINSDDQDSNIKVRVYMNLFSDGEQIIKRTNHSDTQTSKHKELSY